MNDAPIEIVPYDGGWPGLFEAERARVEAVAGAWLGGPVEHIGSTAVPGLIAKPIIDIMAGVRTLQDAVPAIPALAAAGYCHFPYRAQVMHWFCKPAPERRTHHLHLVPVESPLWRERLAFRDALRADPKLAQAYAALKLQLAARFRFDREAYTDAKGSFVADVVTAWAGRT